MINSLEARVPFLDSKIVDFSFQLPHEFKIQGTNKKRILKDTFADLLPDETMSFRDILSKLEKLEIIESSEEWSEVREIRNDISHEYPDDHEKMADALNKSYQKLMFLDLIISFLID
jgi:asparagine synthetase B (glutamine-hydrolysing)